MGVLIDGLTSIVEFYGTLFAAIRTLFDFLISCIKDLGYIVQLLLSVAYSLPAVFAFFPSAVVTTLVLGFYVYTVLRVVGRD